MYWTGYVTHKPWGTQKSWAEPAMVETMRLFNLHIAQRLRRYERNLICIGTLDEPGLAWGKTPAGGMASGFPNWDEQAWYEQRGVKFTNDIGSYSDSDWMRYMAVRCSILRQNNQWARMTALDPANVPFSTDLYAPQAVMDGADPLSQQINDIPARMCSWIGAWAAGRDRGAVPGEVARSGGADRARDEWAALWGDGAAAGAAGCISP